MSTHAFVATVPVTLIEAINFVVSFNIKDADVYITRSFVDSDGVAERLSECKLFKNVYIYDDVLLTYPITARKCCHVVLNGKKIVKDISSRSYDYAYYNNSGWLINSIFYTGFIKGNKKCKHRFIEHGYNTYLNEYGRKPWLLGALIKICGYKCMDGSMLEALYMFNPSLLKVPQNGEIRTMPYMDKNNALFVDILNHTFNFDPNKNEFKNKKLIIMEQGPLKEEFDIEEFWKNILSDVEKETAIIKCHPRQRKSALQNMGIELSNSNTIPWEVIALNTEMEDKVQMTIFSGSCIIPKTCCNIESTVILLYKLLPIDYSFIGEKVVELTNEIGTQYEDEKKFFIPETLEELKNYCKEHIYGT